MPRERNFGTGSERKPPQDYYDTLGLRPNATQAEIKSAYWKLAKENHPDKKPGDAEAEARFKEVNEANEMLSDPKKRQRYDQSVATGGNLGGIFQGFPDMFRGDPFRGDSFWHSSPQRPDQPDAATREMERGLS